VVICSSGGAFWNVGSWILKTVMSSLFRKDLPGEDEDQHHQDIGQDVGDLRGW